VQAIEAIIEKEQPEIIYTHFEHDLNIDHRIVYQAVITACRPQKGQCVREIYSFEVPSSTEWQTTPFTSNMVVDISDHIETKMTALKAYDTEMRPAPHSRSYDAIKALATWRGQSHGFQYGEAFQAVRILK
jgi:LmbE family N-acetylglucosaminyl deacetylase